MNKMIYVISLLFSFQVFSYEATIVVLEAPLFLEPNSDSMVVQYYRKGDVIKLHPEIKKQLTYEELNPDPNKNIIDVDEEFIKTHDRLGRVAYILREHIYIYYQDRREFTQSYGPSPDPTDYRLLEPLPPNYPLVREKKYSGSFLIGISEPNQVNYPYPTQIKARGYNTSYDFMMNLSRKAPGYRNDRLFLGIGFKFKYFKNNFLLVDNTETEESHFRFGIGPHIQYDLYREHKNTLQLIGLINLNLLNKLTITQTQAELQEERIYQGFGFNPHLGIQYLRSIGFENTQLIASFIAESDLFYQAKSNSKAKQPNLWKNAGIDRFKNQANFSMGLMIGVQNAY